MKLPGSIRSLPLILALAACESPAEAPPPAQLASAVAREYGMTPLEQLILSYQEAGILTPGLANSLLVKAHAGFRAAEAGAADAAGRHRRAFVAQVNSLLAEGVLTAEQAAALLGAEGLRTLQDLLPGTWAFEGVGFCFNWQVTHGTLTIEWVDRDAGVFSGMMTYLSGLAEWHFGGTPPYYVTGPISNDPHMDPHGAISFSAPFQFQFWNPPQTGIFDGTTIRTSWTANCGARSDAGGPVTHEVVYTRVE